MQIPNQRVNSDSLALAANFGIGANRLKPAPRLMLRRMKGAGIKSRRDPGDDKKVRAIAG
jgi:hypothetical protein